MSSHSTETYWRRRAYAARLRLNLGWWLALFLPTCLVLNLLFSCFVLYARGREQDLGELWLGYAVMFLLSAASSYFGARRRFYSEADSIVHLETVLNLHNRLSAAAAGVGDWPEREPSGWSCVRWRWPRVLGPIAISLLLLFVAHRLPVSPPAQASSVPSEEPLAWARVEDWMDLLEEEELVEPEALEEFREQIDELRSQSPDEWYEHGGLEAGENLESKAEQALRQLGRSMSELGQELNRAKEELRFDQEDAQGSEGSQTQGAEFSDPQDSRSEAQEPGESQESFDSNSPNDSGSSDESSAPDAGSELDQQTLERMGELLEKLKQNSLPLNPDLHDQLEQFQSSKGRSLSAEELEELLERLERGDAVVGEALGDQECEGQGEMSSPGDSEGGQPLLMPGQGGQQGQDGQPSASMPGSGKPGAGAQGKTSSGGISRGPGAAPLDLSEDKTELRSRKNAGLTPGDHSRSELSDTVGVSRGEHEVDPSQFSGTTGGGLKRGGEGGVAVWKDRLTPSEQDLLRRYFK